MLDGLIAGIDPLDRPRRRCTETSLIEYIKLQQPPATFDPDLTIPPTTETNQLFLLPGNSLRATVAARGKYELEREPSIDGPRVIGHPQDRETGYQSPRRLKGQLRDHHRGGLRASSHRGV